MNSWHEYVNTWSNMYAELTRNTSKMNEYWLDSFSKFWSGQYKDKLKVGNLYPISWDKASPYCFLLIISLWSIFIINESYNISWVQYLDPRTLAVEITGRS
jgi:hypothetical protein